MTDATSSAQMSAWLDAEAQLAEDSARHYDHEGEPATLVDPLRQQAERLRAAAALIRELEGREKALAAFVENAKAAVDFYDRVKDLPSDERIAVGTDDLDWIVKVARRAAKLLAPASPTQENA